MNKEMQQIAFEECDSAFFQEGTLIDFKKSKVRISVSDRAFIMMDEPDQFINMYSSVMKYPQKVRLRRMYGFGKYFFDKKYKVKTKEDLEKIFSAFQMFLIEKYSEWRKK